MSNLRNYKDLIVYQKAKKNAIDIVRYFSPMNLSWTEKYIVDQLIRASTSISANIAEGYGRLNRLDYRRFILISRGSSFEVEYWIDLLMEIRPDFKKFLEQIAITNSEIIKILTTLTKKLANH